MYSVEIRLARRLDELHRKREKQRESEREKEGNRESVGERGGGKEIKKSIQQIQDRTPDMREQQLIITHTSSRS